MRISALLVLLIGTLPVRADLFDDISNKDIQRIITTDAAQMLTEVSANQLSMSGNVMPQSNATILFLLTKEGRYAKLQVQAGWQKVNSIRYPVLFIEKFVTYKAGDEQSVIVKGGPILLFAGLHFNADLGQVVSSAIGGDIEMAPAEVLVRMAVKPVSEARLYLLKRKPNLELAKSDKSEFAEPFQPKHFNGKYKLFDDGRRSGSLTLNVDETSSQVNGSFYSDKDGQKYEVTGKLGAVRHQINFTIKFPQSAGEYTGHMFTGDGKAIAGISKLRDRDTAFYALRQDGNP